MNILTHIYIYPYIFVAYIIPGARSSGSIGHKYLRQKSKKYDEWWRARAFIYGFNEVCKNIAASYLKVGNESMSAIYFWNTEKGDLPNLSYILHKP